MKEIIDEAVRVLKAGGVILYPTDTVWGLGCDATNPEAVAKVFDFRPGAIIRELDLRKPIYRQLAAYGHMGREDLGVRWEQCDKVEELKAAVGM